MIHVFRKHKVGRIAFVLILTSIVFLGIPNEASAQSVNTNVIMSDVTIDVYLGANTTGRMIITANVTNQGTLPLSGFDVNLDLRELIVISATIDLVNTTASVMDAERSSYVHLAPDTAIPSLSSVYLELELTSNELQEQYQVCDERNLCLSSMIYYIRPVNEITYLTFSVTLPPHAVLDEKVNPLHPEPTSNHTDGYSMVFVWELGSIYPDDAVVFIVKYGIPVSPELDTGISDVDTTATIFLVAALALLGGAVAALVIERVPSTISNMRSRRLVGSEGISKQEKEVVTLLLGKGGSCLQREIYEELDMSQSLVSMLLTGLEERGLIRRLREGRENVVYLIEE